MEGEGHLLSNHVDIKATINNTIKHFLYVKSFCDEQKLLESHSPRPECFCNSSNRLWGELDFSTLSTNNECNQRKSCMVCQFPRSSSLHLS